MIASPTPTQSAVAISSPKACDAGPAASHFSGSGAAYSVIRQSAAVDSNPRTCGAGPAVFKYRRRATPFQSDALREGSEVLPCVVALHDRENAGSHHCDGGKVCREVGNVCRD